MGLQITYRSAKGAPLTIEEQDGNLRALADAVDVLAGSVGGVFAVGFEQDPDTLALTISYSDSTIIGPVVLPVRPLRFRGEWTTGSAYDVSDVVRYEGSSYGVAVAHVAADQLDLVVQHRRSVHVAMHLFDQRIERAHAMAAAQQFLAYGTTDEAGPAGHENMFGHVSPSPPCELIRIKN